MRELYLICDNRPYLEGLTPSWGLSIGIRDAEGWTLFDMGDDPKTFLHNFKALGGDVRDIKQAIFSHLHHDHTGGLEALLDTDKPIPIYLPEKISEAEAASLAKRGLMVYTVPRDGMPLGDVWLLPQPWGNPPEQLLVLKSGEEIILLTGCAHFGIENGLQAVWQRFGRPFKLVLGGFHFAFRSSIELEEALILMKSLPIAEIAPCHCTGDSAIATFARTFPDKFLRVGTGWRFSFE
jgi:7,8-dihydropterin-6-yl-methyl-4-(beta-D-ribofuranosyl)aminobenzene 5'-phosphate synthase